MKQNLKRHPTLLRKSRGVALVIVLGFVVLLCLLVVAYFSRIATDRQLAGASFNQMDADLLARGALEIIVGDFKQEIVAGSTMSIVAGVTTYTPTAAANAVPQRSGGQAAIPNLIRRSVSSDPIASPGVGSRASTVNSTNVSVNGRSVSLSRWNSHYLIPKSNLTNDSSDPVATFTAPDWVLISRNGPSIQTGIGSGSSALNDRSVVNSNYIIGRYAYAVYDEGGLLDINIAGFPSPTPAPATIAGRKGTVAFADLTALPTTGSGFVTNAAINRIVGWRNYATVQPTGTFPSFTFNATSSSAFATYFLDTVRNFGFVGTAVSGGRTDQAFLTRAQLINLRADISASVFMLQYLATFSLERNLPTWKAGTASLTERFNIGNLNLVKPNPLAAQNADIQKYFGLRWVNGTAGAAGPPPIPAIPGHWQYVGSSGASMQRGIPAFTANPEFFQLLNYGMNGTNTNDTTNIVATLSRGAAIIDQYDDSVVADPLTGTTTTMIEYDGGWAIGLENTDPARPSGSPAPSPFPTPGGMSPTPPPLVPGYTMLNRPFRNVGELGYSLRASAAPTATPAAPKTLDFVTAASPDAPLLDLFTYNTANPRSGIVSLNTRNSSVLAAILKGVFPTEAASSGLTNAQATSAAASIVTATTALPAIGRQDVARLASAPATAPFTTDEENRESIARALAEVGQTRIWGLLIDVVAQSGKYPPAAAGLADFVVEGEKRYWLHVAIDRLTGEVIDQQLEAVYE